MDPNNNVGSRDGFDRVVRIDTPDPYTAVVHLRERYARAVPYAFPELIPEHLLRGVALNGAPFDALPIGTGPFRVVAWKRGEAIDLIANDRYYRGKPKVRAVRVLFVSSVTTRAVMLQTGEADIAALDRDAYRQIAGSPNVRIVIAPKRAFTTFFLNVTRPLLADVRVRRALAYAIDRRAIVDAGAFGRYRETLANGYAGPPSFAYDPALAPIPYDPKRAGELLDAAGWRRGTDGVRVKGGRRLTLLLAQRAGATTDNAVNTLAEAMLRNAGVETAVKTYAEELIFAPTAAGGLLATGKFDLYYDTYDNLFDPDSSWLLTCARAEPNGYNESRFCSRELDGLEAAALATYDEAERKRYYARIDRIVQDAVPLIYISWPEAVYGTSTRLRGFSFNGMSATWNAGDWAD